MYMNVLRSLKLWKLFHINLFSNEDIDKSLCFLQCSSRRELYSPFYCCSNCYFQMTIKKSCVPVYSYRFPTPPTRCPFQFRSQYLHPKKHFSWIWCKTDFELNMYWCMCLYVCVCVCVCVCSLLDLAPTIGQVIIYLNKAQTGTPR